MKTLGLVVSLYLLLPIATVGQSDFRVAAGFGHPCGYCLSTTYNKYDIILEFVYGFPADLRNRDRGVFGAINAGYRFGKSENVALQKPWIIRVGPAFVSTEDFWVIERKTLLFASLGREFNISPKVGSEFLIGFPLMVFENEVRKGNYPISWGFFFIDPLVNAGSNFVYLDARIMLFYRI
tara:strand:+ start:5935 stop:6474 length:540 start_codon:yes stop_codon:yes gene_type:complete